MKKVYLMKGMAAMAFGLVVASCNKMDAFNPYAEQEAKQQEFAENFQSAVMNGQSIDPNQTWATTTPVQVSVTPRTAGTLKIYTANPIGNVVASLYTADVTAGTKTTFTVAKPADVSKLYAAVIDAKGMIDDLLTFDASGESVTVNFNTTASNRAPRRTAPAMRTMNDNDVKASIDATYSNPITKPDEPTGMPTADNADFKILKSTTLYGFENGKTYYIAPNVVVTLANGNFNGNTKIYMGANSKVVKPSGNLYLGAGSVLYNDGGTIEGEFAGNGSCFEKCTIWNKGTINAKNTNLNSSDNDPGVTIYNSGTIKNVADFQVGKNGLLYNEGTITATGTLKGNNDKSQIYNAANCTITAGGLLLNNNSQYLWNDGTLDINGAISFTNCVATLVNNDSIEAESFDGSAGGCFHNMTNKTVTISGATNMTNANAIWVNDGEYTTETFNVAGGRNPIFNNCHLKVTDKFSIGGDGSYFVLQGDASVFCGDFDWNGDAYFWMGADSWLKVDGTLKSNNINNDGKGFIQYGENMAVISANAITTDNTDSQARFCVYGKVCIDANGIFDLTETNHIFGEDVEQSGQMYTADVPEAWKTATTCRPAFTPEEKKKDAVMWYYYAFEDLGTTDDFDFNDVIIRVSAPVEGKSTMELVAAGGTMPTYIMYDGERANESEVHTLIGASSVTDMINTGRGAKKDFAFVKEITGLTATTKMDELPIGISITGNNGQLINVTRTAATPGRAPLVVVVSGYSSGENAGKWFWPTERTKISTAYQQFGAWGANASENEEWYWNYTGGSVFTW